MMMQHRMVDPDPVPKLLVDEPHEELPIWKRPEMKDTPFLLFLVTT